MDFLPLELWRASSLAQETKSVIAAYERCLASGDMDGLSELRASIENRIDALEAFYTRHLDDERSLLFEKQRLKLRKLLHEYDAAVAALGSSRSNAAPASAQRGGAGGMSAAATAAAALAGSASYGLASPGAPTTTRVIREDSRLTLAETAAWFAQAGAAEMPDLTFACVEKVFGHVTRTNVDGRMSVRDLRQWYISFGKLALKNGLTASDLEKELVPSKSLTHSRAAHVTGGARPGTSSGARPAGGSVLYPWEAAAKEAKEAAAAVAEAAGAGAGAPAGGAVLALPNHMVEFQLRLTKAEFEAMQLRRRQIEAEARYKDRVAKARAERGQGEGGGGGGGGSAAEPYAEPLHALSTILHRS